MDLPISRLDSCVRHLKTVDEFFSTNDPLYKYYVSKLHKIQSYDSFARSIYSGDFGRGMQLSDLLTYVLVSRGTIWGMDKDKRSDYLRILITTVNQLLIQEHVTYFPKLRAEFLEFLEKRKIDFYIEGEKYAEYYKKAKRSDKALTYSDDRYTYWSIDHLLPKSVGLSIELVVFLYLLRSLSGYVIPLLLEQRLLGNPEHLVSPDFLVVQRGRVFGVEVEQGGKTGKVRQSNTFMQETGIPILTASVPTTFPLRCKVCNKWILFCDNIIDNFCNLKYKIDSSWISCDSCNQVVYFGRLEKGGDEYHYHFDCVKKEQYVKEKLADKDQREKRLIAYFPHVEGLERLVLTK